MCVATNACTMYVQTQPGQGGVCVSFDWFPLWPKLDYYQRPMFFTGDERTGNWKGREETRTISDSNRTSRFVIDMTSGLRAAALGHYVQYCTYICLDRGAILLASYFWLCKRTSSASGQSNEQALMLMAHPQHS